MDRRGDVTDADEDESPIGSPSPTSTKTGDRFSCPRCGCEIEVRKPTGIRPHQIKPFVCQCGTKMHEI
jgi:hypothetical protein